jgi:hypothetical protein
MWVAWQQLMQDERVELNPRMPWQSSIQHDEGFFQQQIGLRRNC